MDRILKLVYPYTYKRYETVYQYFNGLHYEVIAFLNQKWKEQGVLFNPENELNMLLERSENRNWLFNCHSNFYHYFSKDYHNQIVDETGILDDNAIYLYPIEIRTTINQIIDKSSLFINGRTIEYNLIDTIPATILNHIRSGKVKIIFNTIHDPCVSSAAMVKIEEFFNQYGISGENVIFIWGNNYQRYKTDAPDSKIKLTYGILPLQQQAQSMFTFPQVTSLGYVSDIVRENDLDRTKYRSKRFLCFNRTMKPHRYMLAHLWLKHDLFQNSIISFLNSNGDDNHILNQLGVFTKLSTMNQDITLERAKQIRDLIPYQIDTHDLPAERLPGFTTDNNKKEFYLDTYIHLTSETLFEYGDIEHPFFSEKTFRPIQNLQPFIFIGEPNSLRLLRDLGFKTFSPFIDETYDTITNPIIRMALIEKEIKKFNDMPLEQLHDWYYSITDTLIYNQKHFMTFAGTNPFDQAFTDINKFYSA